VSIFFILSKIISYNLSNKGKSLTKRDFILAGILGFLYFLTININIMYIKELICIILALSPIAVGSSLGGFLGLKAKMGADSAGNVEPNSLYDLHRFFMEQDKGKKRAPEGLPSGSDQVSKKPFSMKIHDLLNPASPVSSPIAEPSQVTSSNLPSTSDSEVRKRKSNLMDNGSPIIGNSLSD